MIKLSTGEDSTLGNYKQLAIIFFGIDSPSVQFLDDKIKTSTNGEKEEVIADETQMIYLLNSLHFDNQQP
jgi:hypothetical protein